MKKRFLVLGLACALLMSGCSSSTENGAALSVNESASSSQGFDNYNYSSDSGDVSEDNVDVEDESYDSNNSEQQSETTSTSNRKIDKEMLVYRCNLNLDTLDFDKTTIGIKSLIDEMGGFIESEAYSDNGGTYSYYYVDDDEKHNTYKATIRIPSSKYDDFIDSVGSLGDVRSKDSNVENMTQEYTDAKTALQIYQEKEKRYISMISTATDEVVAMQLEKELTDLEIQIAQLKTRMENIENDVAYSYVELSVSEVRKYSSHGGVKSTFMQRLLDTFKETYSDFFNFLEELLFLIIRLFPYVVLFGVIAFGVVKCIKIRRKKLPKKEHNDKPIVTNDLPPVNSNEDK